MEEKSRASWEQFRQTGEIEAYLLYRQTTDFMGKEDKEGTWQQSEQEALS